MPARKSQKRRNKNRHKQPLSDLTVPFIAHVRELRRRLAYIALSVGLFGAAAYAVEHSIVELLLRPAHGQHFIYTSPGGGIDFLFRVCLYTGIICSVPVIIFQFLRYIEPLIKRESVHFIAWGSIASGLLAVAGVFYGYVWGLPAALHFLLHQFITQQIQPLVTIQSYLSFVMVYMVGSALLFQIPLVLIFINRIKPLKPKGLFKYERHVIVGAVVLAALMNPTPNVFALLLLAGPMILMYQVGIFIIWRTNRVAVSPSKVKELREQDRAAREARVEHQPLAEPRLAVPSPLAPATLARPMARPFMPAPAPRPAPRAIARQPVRTFSDFTVVRRIPPGGSTLEQQSQNPA